MLHPKQHITDLAVICKKKGVARAVISPGSRSAPLIKAFYEVLGEDCISIVDERSAAYFALGLAAYSRSPVALLCTSGTAVLNYAPALAEAYYQHVPLLAVTADRPGEWIDQQDNQTLRQPGIYSHYVKNSYNLPQSVITGDDLWYAHRMVNEAVNLCCAPSQGPVHINVPLSDPLYGELPSPTENIRVIHRIQPEGRLELPAALVDEWKNASRIMVIHGQDHPGSEVARILPGLLNDGRVVILAENIANMPDPRILSTSNLVLSQHRGRSPAYPDLILHSGGQVVSKALTGYLRRAGDVPCWRIGTDQGTIDTFQHITREIPCMPQHVYRTLQELAPANASADFSRQWKDAAAESNDRLTGLMQKIPFTDLSVIGRVLPMLPPETIVSLGNSSIIRYSQLFPANRTLRYFSNRGVSGIDGGISTAAGIAFASRQLTLAITGDLGFLYDSNGLWNRNLPAGLRVLVINNGGGGIFHILKGPSEQPGFKQYIEANHPVNIHKLAEAFGLCYYLAENEPSLTDQWDAYLHGEGAAVLEVRTDAGESAAVFRQLMGLTR
jgi:2-succinyl-5-enolpyruvyl-6-hydroxy-3-cyclohexene-1-carboxylate synthase